MILVQDSSSNHFVNLQKQTIFLINMGLFEVMKEMRELTLHENFQEQLDVSLLNPY